MRTNKLRSIAERAMRERGLLPHFSAEALQEAAAITEAPTDTGVSVRDLRKLLWASIDNDTSRDLDQLTVAKPISGGGLTIFVAVADVDATVKRRSAIDRHAETNTTSVYTAAAIFPMLPERLSTNLTSLSEGEERLAIVVEMELHEDGSVKRSDVYRATVVNHAQLAYNAVAAWLDGLAPPPPKLHAVPGLEAQLRMQDQAAQGMRGLRYQHGALSLQTPEAEAVFSGDELIDLRPAEANRAKELIEDFMIAANGATAAYLERRGLPSIRRVLRSPERWARIVALAAGHGDRVGVELVHTDVERGFVDFARMEAR